MILFADTSSSGLSVVTNNILSPLVNSLVSLVSSWLPHLSVVAFAFLSLWLGRVVYSLVKGFASSAAFDGSCSDCDLDSSSDFECEDSEPFEGSDGYIHYDGMIFEDEGDLNDYIYMEDHPEEMDGFDEWWDSISRSQ